MNRAEAIKYMAEKPEENMVQNGNRVYYFYEHGGLAFFKKLFPETVYNISGIDNIIYQPYRKPVKYLSRREIAEALLHGKVIVGKNGTSYRLSDNFILESRISSTCWRIACHLNMDECYTIEVDSEGREFSFLREGE